MSDEISLEIRQLIPVLNIHLSEVDLMHNVLVDQYVDLMSEISDLNVVSSDIALNRIETLKTSSDSEVQKIVLAGLGGVYTFIGDYIKAFTAFHRAFDLAGSPESYCIIYSELSNLLRKLGYQNQAVAILEKGIKLTSNEKLRWRLKTQKALCYKYSDPKLSIELLAKSLEYHEFTNNMIRIARMKRHLGEIYINARDFKTANKCFDEAMEIAVEESLVSFQNEVTNDKGWLWIKQRQYDDARVLFNKLIQKDLSPYLMSLALQNLGYLEFESVNYLEAVNFHSQSLKITTQYQMRDMAFEDYYKLGLSHERLFEVALADHYFSTGYQEVMKEFKMGLQIINYRKKVMDAYVDFLRRNQRVLKDEIEEDIFCFALDKTMKDIRDIFHTNLLNLHLSRTKNAPEMCKKLDINTRTYFMYQKKLGLKRGELQKSATEINPYFKEYLVALAPLSWTEANKKFEKDLYSYLLGKYQHNKKKLAEVLDVSYIQVILKTK